MLSCLAAWTAASFVSLGGVRRAEAKPGGRRPCFGVPGTARWIASLDDGTACGVFLEPEAPERVGDGGGGEDGVVEKDEPSAGSGKRRGEWHKGAGEGKGSVGKEEARISGL